MQQNNGAAIHAASANGHRAVVAVLLEVGGTKAKMAKNKFRQSPLDLAKKYKHADVASLLQRHVAM